MEITKATGRDSSQLEVSGAEYAKHLAGPGYPRDFADLAKRLREPRFVERIPVSAAGKVLERELRRRLAVESAS